MDDKWDKPGFGRLFANKKKTSEMHPDFTGTFVVERGYAAGEKIQFGMWEKITKHGATFFSLRESNFTPTKREPEDQEVAYRPRNRNDDDVPF